MAGGSLRTFFFAGAAAATVLRGSATCCLHYKPPDHKAYHAGLCVSIFNNILASSKCSVLPYDIFCGSPLQIHLSVKGCAKCTWAAKDISDFINGSWHWHNNSIWSLWVRRSKRKREREITATKLCGVLKIVKQFSRPATFKSIKIDLFVMRADPFGIPQAWNLREMAVSIRKTERQRLKDDRGKERDERSGVNGRAGERVGKKDNIALI